MTLNMYQKQKLNMRKLLTKIKKKCTDEMAVKPCDSIAEVCF